MGVNSGRAINFVQNEEICVSCNADCLILIWEGLDIADFFRQKDKSMFFALSRLAVNPIPSTYRFDDRIMRYFSLTDQPTDKA